MQTELVNQIEVKLRKFIKLHTNPHTWKKCSHAPKTILIMRVVRLILFPKKRLSYCLWRQHFRKNKHPLQTLNEFLQEYAQDVITDVHLLPIFPSTSDDGFSVTDYKQIDEQLGDWDDVQKCLRTSE